ncbi:MAG: CoA transferase [Gammaproteobacteria bacterium]|nr:CoA transferase [Gammaproteobacteria bacterium]NIR84998.1 CoA transferase [Gammaproteobacteria bacterium]NIR88265.1 CoA transferase [Gammaproteobacteria bacterium]NIU06045.1 CoA transferase [Gammaproteobacteria bacterium]NIV73464.1 CoA transferase [Gammaproteobacteria bacterium]
MSAPLEGLFVVSLEQAVAAPFTSSRLADAGARVIKVERPGGDFARRYDTVVDGESAYFVWLNRGKESIELDIKDPDDAGLLQRMLQGADVFIQNLAPGAAARAGFATDMLRRRSPRLITCDLSGYGEQGPYRDMKAYDLLIQAETGLASVTGSPHEPGRVGVSIADIAAGMYALNGIVQALYRRERTGEGSALKVSLFDAMADWMTVPLLYQQFTGAAPERVGLAHPSIAPYGVYRSGESRRVVIAIQNEREWTRFCAEVLEDEGLATDPRFCDNEARVAHRRALDATIGQVFERLEFEALVQKLAAARIAFGALNSVADLAAHPQLRRALVSTPSGTAAMPLPPVVIAGEEVALRPVPRLGEHSAAIRAEFAAPDGCHARGGRA